MVNADFKVWRAFRLRIWAAALLGLLSIRLMAHPADTVAITQPEAEAMFLQRNLRLLAAKLEIHEARAQMIQAKLWPNPTLAIDEINLWSNHGAEALGSLFGAWGNHAQVAVDIEQVIQTAGKRKKLIAAETAGLASAEHRFEDVLRSLRVELRAQLAELSHTQQREHTYRQTLEALQKLLHAYQRQLQQGNISHSEYLRLRASEAELLKDIADIKKENHHAQQALKVLLGIAPAHELTITGTPAFEFDSQAVQHIQATTILEWVVTHNAEVQAMRWDVTQAEHRLRYEQAQRIPDVAVKLGYDRGGNIMRDFIGLGVSMDLPFFNRNQGNIRAAQAMLKKSRLQAEAQQTAAGAAAVNAWKDLLATLEQRAQFGPAYEADMDALLQQYHHSFGTRNLSLLEYLDFLKAYLDTKDYILGTQRDGYIHYETLRYHVGNQLP